MSVSATTAPMTYRGEMTEPLGARIRRLRTDRGWTQRELAEPGYDRGFLAKVETGSRPPSEEMLAYLAGRLGLTVDDLRFGRPPGVADELRASLDEGYRDLEQGRVALAEERFAAVGKQAAGYRLDDVECYARFCLAEVKWQLFDVEGAQKGAGARFGTERSGTAVAAGDDRAPLVGLPVPERRRGRGDRPRRIGAGFSGPRPRCRVVPAQRVDPPADGDGRAAPGPARGLDGLRLARAASRPDFVARFHRQASQVWQATGRSPTGPSRT